MMNKRQVVVLETPRLLLRHMEPDDADALFLIYGDPETIIHFPHIWTFDEVGDYILRNQMRYDQYGFGMFTVVEKESGKVIGACGLSVHEVDGVGETECGYHFNRRWWGKGLATEAARACVDWGFRGFDLGRIISLIKEENWPSRRVAERNGMTLQKQALWRGLPHLVYAITRVEWDAANSAGTRSGTR